MSNAGAVRHTHLVKYAFSIARPLVTALGFLPGVLSSRESSQRWLLGARRAQIVLGATLLFGFFVVPPAVDGIADTIYPPQKVRRLFKRRVKRAKEAKTLASTLSLLYWLGTAGSVLSLLVLDLPGVARRKERHDELGGASTILSTSTDRNDAASAAATIAMEPEQTASSIETPQNTGTGQRYSIEGELGRGGMGVVYRARDSVLGRQVALKELPVSRTLNETLISRFRQEARALAQLTHANIVQVYDLVEEGETRRIAMELVEGDDLSARIKKDGAMSVEEALPLLTSMAQALVYAHERGVVHRDFKPHNVLIDASGQPKITDFGMAKLSAGPELTQEGAIMGSPSYMSPEQASGKPTDKQTDVYSLAVTIFEMLSGTQPFTGATMKVLLSHVNDPPPRLEEVPSKLAILVVEMMAKDPGDRPSMPEVVSRLSEIS